MLMSAQVFHIPFLLALPNHYRLAAIVQRTPSPSNTAKADHHTVKFYPTTEELLSSPTPIDLVIISTPPSTHYPLAKLCLQASKHIIIEKPFTPTSREANELIALAKHKNSLLTVYQNRRWDNDFLLLSRLIREGTLGRVVEFETHFDRHRPDHPSTAAWKTESLPGNGAIYDLGTHLIDQVVATFGLPNRVTGFLYSQRLSSGGDEPGDSFTVLLHYDEKGILATAKAGIMSPEQRQLRFWVRGQKGSFKKWGMDPQEGQLKAGMKLRDPEFGQWERGNAEWELSTFEKGQPLLRRGEDPGEPETYLGFYRQMARALDEEAEVPLLAEVARDVIRLIELVTLSSAKGMTLKVAEQWEGVDF